MAARGRSVVELKAVPEDDKLSNHISGASAVAPAGSLGRDAIRSAGGSVLSRSNGPARERAFSLSKPSFARPARLASTSRTQSGALSRTSIMIRLQQSGRQLADMGKLQAEWLKNTLGRGSETQDYVNEADQGVVALLARHVDVTPTAWQKLQSLGGNDGHFWQNECGPGEFIRYSEQPNNQSSKRLINHDGERGRPNTFSEGCRSDSFSCRDRAAEEGKAGDGTELKPGLSIFGMPVIQPYNLFAVLWTMLILLLDLIYTAFWVPMNVAFCTAEYGKLSSGCTTSDLVGGILYFLNVLLGFQIGVVATNGVRKRTVMDGRLVAWLYACHGRFWLDFVASVPLVYLVVVLAGRTHFHLNKGWVNCLSLLRLLRMVRLVSITKVMYMDSLSGRFQDSWLARWMSVTVIYSALLAYQLAVAINLFACIMVLCAYFEGYSNSWMTAVDWAQVPTASPMYQWYCAVYWMIVTATTTGFGDFAPRSIAEQVVSNVAMVGGMIMFGVLVASIGQALSKATREALQAYNARQKIIHVLEWAEHRHLPEKMKKEVQTYFADKYGRTEEESVDTAMMSVLPSRLRAKVALAICHPLISSVHILNELSNDVQSHLAEIMRPIRLPAGEDICQQGDVTNCFWILQEGQVEAVRYKEGSKVLIDAVEMPQLLGESVLLGEVVEASRIRPWTLSTKTACRLWGVTLGELYPLMRMHPSIGKYAAEYVKYKTINSFAEADVQGAAESGIVSNSCPSDQSYWCEVAAVILGHLMDASTPRAKAQELVRELAMASGFDGTVQPLLERLLQFCATRRGLPVADSEPQPPLSPQSTQLLPPPPLNPPTLPTTTALIASASNIRRHMPLMHNPSWTAPSGRLEVAGTDLTADTTTGGTDGGNPSPAHAPPMQALPSAFSSPAAVATLSAALRTLKSGKMDPPGQNPPPRPHPQKHQHQLAQLSPKQQQHKLHGGSSVPQPPLAGSNTHLQSLYSSGGAGPGAAEMRLPNPVASTSPLSAAISVAASVGGSTTVHCPGCQRCICPSCGQGTEPTTTPPLARVATALTEGGGGGSPASHNLYGGASSGGGGFAPAAISRPGVGMTSAMRAWLNRRGTLRRVSIGMRTDQVWSTERRSLDRRLNGSSNMFVYE